MAVFLIVVGVTPIAYLTWWASAHNLQPLTFVLPLHRGVYTSPYFRTDLDEDYQVELDSVPCHQGSLDLEWQIVDESGRVMRISNYQEGHETCGNSAVLDRSYRPVRGSRQRIIVTIYGDVQPEDAKMTLYVGLPEEMLGQSYAIFPAVLWAVCLAGGGVLTLLIVAVALRSKTARRQVNGC